MKKDNEYILKVLQLASKYDLCGDLYWRTDDEYEPCTFFVNCNDVFAWACADCEEITPENIDELERAMQDCIKASNLTGGEIYGEMLFCCRIRKMRPQGAAYPKKCPDLWPLFDACGPERKTDFGNPHPHPKDVVQHTSFVG